MSISKRIEECVINERKTDTDTHVELLKHGWKQIHMGEHHTIYAHKDRPNEFMISEGGHGHLKHYNYHEGHQSYTPVYHTIAKGYLDTIHKKGK